MSASQERPAEAMTASDIACQIVPHGTLAAWKAALTEARSLLPPGRTWMTVQEWREAFRQAVAS